MVFQFLPNTKRFSTIGEQISNHSHTNFQIFWFYLVIVQTRCGNLMKLVNRLVPQLAIAFNTLLSVTFHVVPPNCVSLQFWHLYLCPLSFENKFRFPSQFGYWFVLIAVYIQDFSWSELYGPEKPLNLKNRRSLRQPVHVAGCPTYLSRLLSPKFIEASIELAHKARKMT